MAEVTETHTLEDAIIKAGLGKFNYFLIVISGLVLSCGFLEPGSITMVLPIAQCELELTNYHKGLIGSVGYIGIILSSHFWGFIADTKGRKKVMVPALILCFTFSVFSAFSKSFWFLALFRFLNGFCVCGPTSIVYAFLGEFHSPKNRARVLMVASVIYGIFCLISPLNGFLLLRNESWNFYIPFLDLNFTAWRVFLIMCSVPSLVAAAAIAFLIPESPKFTFSQGNEAKTLNILRNIFRLNTGKSILEYEVKKIEQDKEFAEGNTAKSCGFFKFMWSQTAPLFKSPNLRNTATACFLQFGVCVACNGFYTFFPEIMNKVYLWLDDNSGVSATVCEVLSSFHVPSNSSMIIETTQNCVTKLELNTFANLIMLTALYSGGWLLISFIINWTGKLAIMVTWMLVCGTSSILLIFVESPSAAVYLYLVLLVSGINMTIVNASTIELYPTSLRAMAVSISMMTGRIGSVVGSNFVGLMIKDYCAYTWILPAVLLISGACLSFTIPNISKRGKDLGKKEISSDKN